MLFDKEVPLTDMAELDEASAADGEDLLQQSAQAPSRRQAHQFCAYTSKAAEKPPVSQESSPPRQVADVCTNMFARAEPLGGCLHQVPAHWRQVHASRRQSERVKW